MARSTNIFFNAAHVGGTYTSAYFNTNLLDANQPACLYVKYRGNTTGADIQFRLMGDEFDGLLAGGRLVDGVDNAVDSDQRIVLPNLPDTKYRVWFSAPALTSMKLWMVGQVLVTGLL